MNIKDLDKLLLQLSSGFINAVAQDIETGIYYALESLAEILPADRAYAIFFKQQEKQIEKVYSFPVNDLALSTFSEMNELPWSIDANHGKLAYYGLNNPSEVVNNTYLKKNNIEQGLVLKMMYGRRTVGLLILERFNAGGHVPLTHSETHLLAISKIISNGLMHNRLTQDLQAAASAAEKANQIKSQFLATMSHEIRTPLHVILATTELMQDEPLSTQGRQKLSMLQSASESLLSLVNDILDLSKIEQGHLAIEQMAVNVFDLITNLVRVFEPIAKEKDVEIIVKTDEQLPTNIETDPTRLKQILSNLLNNAIKFSANGAVTITTMYRSEGKHLGHLTIRVKDTGIGIPEDQITNVFNSFSQVDSSTTRQYGGTGLGLAICKELSQLLKGDISVKSTLGLGSEFTLEIPVLPLQDEATTTPSKAPAKVQFENANRILLAEDSIDNVKIIEYLLKNTKSDLTIVNNGQEAVNKFKANQFDLILMDVQMPKMNGLDATRSIRKIEAENNLRATPIIAITANSFIEDKEKSMAAGCSSHLSKPLNKNRFLNELAKFIH